MIAVGIDVSKSKSAVAILDSSKGVPAMPFTMKHGLLDMNALVGQLKNLYRAHHYTLPNATC